MLQIGAIAGHGVQWECILSSGEENTQEDEKIGRHRHNFTDWERVWVVRKLNILGMRRKIGHQIGLLLELMFFQTNKIWAPLEII